MGTHLRELNESFIMNTIKTGFRSFSKIFVPTTLKIYLVLSSLSYTETLTHWYSSERTQWELSNEYQLNITGFRSFQKYLCSWLKVALALEVRVKGPVLLVVPSFKKLQLTLGLKYYIMSHQVRYAYSV